MATRTIQDQNTTLLTALGGTTADGDSVYIDRYAVDYANADLSGSSRDLFLVEATPGYSGTIMAANGGALTLVCNRTSTGTFRNRSRSRRIEVVSSSSAGVIYNIENAPESGGVLQVNTCTTENLYAVAGSTYVESACDLDQAYCYDGATLVLRYGAAELIALQCRGGKTILERDVTNASTYGTAELTLNDTRVAISGALTVNGGIVYIQRCGEIENLNGGAGIVDFTRCETPFRFVQRGGEPGLTLRFSRRTYPLVTFTATANDVSGGPRIVFVD